MSKQKLMNIAMYSCVLLGAAFLMYPIIANIIWSFESSTAVSSYTDSITQLTEEEKAIQLQMAQDYNEYIFATQKNRYVEAYPSYEDIADQSSVLGYIDIPYLKIEKMPFYHGTDYETLATGLGHMASTSIPTGGENTRPVITGHSGASNAVLFSELNLLEKGDVFFITFLGERMAYQVRYAEIVEPDKVDSVEIKEGKDLLTLITCFNPPENSLRILLTGERIPLSLADKIPSREKPFWTYKNTIMLITFLLIAVIVSIKLIKCYRLTKKCKSELANGDNKNSTSREEEK